MNKGAIGFACFIFGSALGALVSWKVLEKKYADIAQEEIDSVKAAFRRRNSENSKDDTPTDIYPKPKIEEPVVTEKPDYSAYSAAKTVESEKLEPEDKPYVISPMEFDGIEGYEVAELTYYAGDDTLVDDRGDPVDDVIKTVGTEFASHFGEYEDDSVFVRNDRHMCDYQILLDSRRYGEVL